MLGVRADDNLVREIKETIVTSNMGGVYDLVLNGYGPGETIGSVHITVPDTIDYGRYSSTNKEISPFIFIKFVLLWPLIV